MDAHRRLPRCHVATRMLRSDDHSLADLPHPIRVDAAFGRPMEEALFGAGFWTALKPWLGAETVPTEWILNRAPGVYELARESSNVPGTVNLGLLSLVLARARLRAHGDRAALRLLPAAGRWELPGIRAA